VHTNIWKFQSCPHQVGNVAFEEVIIPTIFGRFNCGPCHLTRSEKIETTQKQKLFALILRCSVQFWPLSVTEFGCGIFFLGGFVVLTFSAACFRLMLRLFRRERRQHVVHNNPFCFFFLIAGPFWVHNLSVTLPESEQRKSGTLVRCKPALVFKSMAQTGIELASHPGGWRKGGIRPCGAKSDLPRCADITDFG